MKALHTFLACLALAAILPALYAGLLGHAWPAFVVGASILALALTAPARRRRA